MRSAGSNHLDTTSAVRTPLETFSDDEADRPLRDDHLIDDHQGRLAELGAASRRPSQAPAP